MKALLYLIFVSSSYSMSPPLISCSMKRDNMLNQAEEPIVGRFVPECDDSGVSKSICWCVDEFLGEQIPHTQSKPGEAPPDCETKCQEERKNAPERPGAFVPSCEWDGSYSSLQCHGSSGYCWCVDEDGEEIEGTKQGPGRPEPPVCWAPGHPTQCEREQQEGMDAPPGAFVPVCDYKGNYASMQCHGSTGHCWCVNVFGEELDDTLTAPGEDLLDCPTKCQQERDSSVPMPGAPIPDCDDEGNYSPLQCHGSTGECWCVDEFGAAIDNTRTKPGEEPPTCWAPGHPTQCEQEAQMASGDDLMVGMFVPSCDEHGDYSALQCHGSTGHCWCVDAYGMELTGSRTGPGEEPKCGSGFELTNCELEQEAAMMGGGMSEMVGAYIPLCDENGLHMDY